MDGLVEVDVVGPPGTLADPERVRVRVPPLDARRPRLGVEAVSDKVRRRSEVFVSATCGGE